MVRKLFKNKWFWIVIGTIIVMAVACNSQNSNVGKETGSVPQQTTVGLTVTEQPTQTPQIKLHKQDETVTTGGYTVGVEYASRQGVPQYSDLQSGQYAEAVVIDVTVPSDGSNTWIARTMVTLTDMEGNTISRVMNTTDTSKAPKPGATTTIYNEFILTHGGNYILSFMGLSGERVYWSVVME